MDPVTKCQKQLNSSVRNLTRRLIDLLMQSNCTNGTIRMALDRFPTAIEVGMEEVLTDCFEILEELAEEKARNPFSRDN